MKIDASVQSIKATRPSNRDYATYGLPRGHAVSLWAGYQTAKTPCYFWLELEHTELPEVSYRCYSTRAKIKPEEWKPMNPGRAANRPGSELFLIKFEAKEKLPKGRYVLQARMQFTKKVIELPGVTFGVK